MNTMKHISIRTWQVIAVMCCMTGSLPAAVSGLFTYKDEGKSITISVLYRISCHPAAEFV